MCRGCWFLPSLAPLCVLDNEAQSSVTRIRGSPLNWGNQEEVFREVFRPTPFHSPPVQSGRQGWKRRGLCWAVPPLVLGRDFPSATKGPKGGPGAGRGGRRIKEMGVFRPEKGTAFCGVDPRRESPRASPALTVQGQEVPARVHARQDARRGEDSAAGAEPGAAGHTCAVTAPEVSSPSPAPWRPEWTAVGGGRRWARTSPRPPGPPTRVSPRPLLGSRREGGQGTGKPA